MNVYRQLWSYSDARRLSLNGFLAQSGRGITIFGWVLLLELAVGSYRTAGQITACITFGTAISAPILGRLCDRKGAGRIIPFTVILFSLTQVALLFTALEGYSTMLLMPLAFVSGMSTPPLNAAVRSAWTHWTEKPAHAHLRHTAFVADSVVFEMVFVLGPLIFSACLLASHRLGLSFFGTAEKTGAALALLLATLFTILGSKMLTRADVYAPALSTEKVQNSQQNNVATATCLDELTQPGAFEATPQQTAPVRTSSFFTSVKAQIGPLRNPLFVMLMLACVGIAFGFGATPIALTALAETVAEANQEQSAGALTGYWISVWSIGSAIGGVFFGLRQPGIRLISQMSILTFLLGLGYLAWIPASGVTLLLAMALSGAVIAPALSVTAQLVGDYSEEHERTEAFTWLGTIVMVASASGSIVGGMLVEEPDGVTAALYASAGAALFAAAIAILLSRAQQPA